MIHGRGPLDTQGPRHAHPAAGCRSTRVPPGRHAGNAVGKLVARQAGWLAPRSTCWSRRAASRPDDPRPRATRATRRQRGGQPGGPGPAGWLYDRRAGPHVLQAGPMIHGRGPRFRRTLIAFILGCAGRVATRPFAEAGPRCRLPFTGCGRRDSYAPARSEPGGRAAFPAFLRTPPGSTRRKAEIMSGLSRLRRWGVLVQVGKTPADLLRWLQLPKFGEWLVALRQLSGRIERYNADWEYGNDGLPYPPKPSAAESAALTGLADVVSVAHDWLDGNPAPGCPPRPETLSAR